MASTSIKEHINQSLQDYKKALAEEGGEGVDDEDDLLEVSN